MARPRTVETAPEAAEVSRFQALLPALPGRGRGWLEALRQSGMAAYARAGLPSQKIEAWKYTNLNAFRKLALDRSAEPGTAALDAAPSLLTESAQPYRLVFVGGLCQPGLSRLDGLPQGVTLASLADSLADPEVAEHLGSLAPPDASALTALNTALFRDGYFLKLGANVQVARPIEVVSVSLPGATPATAQVRNLVLAEPGARATIVEHHLALGDGVYAVNGVTEARLDRDARLRLYKVQAEGAEAFHIHAATAELAEDAELECFCLMLGAALARNETHVALCGRGASARLNGAYALDGRQHADTLTAVDHQGVETTSRQVYKGVLGDNSRAVFQGKVLVRPGARGADGQQLNKTLLLSDKAEIDSKPELEIHTDDVKCSHGATAGELADDQVFYLRSRGIPLDEARHILVEAFLAEAVAEVTDETVAEAMRGLIRHWLARNDGGRAT